MLSVVMVRTVVIPSKQKGRDRILDYYFYAKQIKTQKILRIWWGRGNKVDNNSTQTFLMEDSNPSEINIGLRVGQIWFKSWLFYY